MIISAYSNISYIKKDEMNKIEKCTHHSERLSVFKEKINCKNIKARKNILSNCACKEIIY